MRELENIRSFLTGNAITLLLDILFSVVFIAVMFFYSGWLTLVAVLSLPLSCIGFNSGHALVASPLERELFPWSRKPGISGGNHQRHTHAQVDVRGTTDHPQMGQPAGCLCIGRLQDADLVEHCQ